MKSSETYFYIGEELSRRGMTYVDLMAQGPVMCNGLLRNFRRVWRGTLILAGGLTRVQATALIDDGLTDLAAFGSPFIANRDFIERVSKGWPLTMASRSSYYGGGGKRAKPTIPSMVKIMSEAQPVKRSGSGTSGSINL